MNQSPNDAVKRASLLALTACLLAPLAARSEMQYAVDRSGQRPVPVVTAPGHCAWPNLKLLCDGRTLAALIFNDASHGQHPGDIECWLSGDGGATWKFGSIANNGDLCVSVYSTQGPWEKYEERKFRSFLYRSKDDGKTWGEPVVIGPDSNETTVLHLGNGRWLASARIGSGVEKKDRLLLFASADDGRTWAFKRTMTGFQRVTGHLARLRDGWVLFSYGDGASDFGKKGLEAMMSADGGETWSAPVRLIDWNGLDGGYPSSVQRGDGQVVTAYYASALPGDPPNSYKNYHMAVIVWDPERTFPRK